MIIRLKKKVILLSVLTVAAIAVFAGLFTIHLHSSSTLVAGGHVLSPLHADAPVRVMASEETSAYDRYRRPSAAKPYPNPYSFFDFQNQPKSFDSPREVILAYFGILNRASNMIGYQGGCGSIGDGLAPYPYAYALLSPEMKKETSLKAFTDSFQGIGYITLLKVVPALSPNPDETAYMVEFEAIRGEKESGDEAQSRGGRFAYYYGIMSAKKTDDGERISKISLIPEDFLCAPEHSWVYLSDAVVQIVYGENLHIIDRIDKTEQQGDMIYIYATGGEKQYRFDFVRITNGYDILLHENICENGEWKETNLPTGDWEMKLAG